MLLPWQHTFCHCQKNVSCTSTPKANICANFMRIGEKLRKKFATQDFSILAIICRYHGNTLSATVKKICVLHIYTQGKHLCQISWELVKSWGSSSRRKIFPHFAIICRYHGNTLSVTVEKCVLHIYTPRHTSVLNFMRVGQTLRK